MLSPKKILKEVYGYDEFRPLQAEVIEHAMSGQDALVIMPTGGGKSICFQIPAQIFPNLTLVISPLISLMKDQVDALNSYGINAAFYNSTLSEYERAIVIDDCLENKLKLLYISPESLIGVYNSWLNKVKISFIVVDEAHCVSMWGHDFRPEYQQIGKLRELYKNVPFMALTATADKITRSDISEKLELKNHQLFLSSFNRPNLHLAVRSQIPKKKKEKEILDFILSRQNSSGIIYCLSRKETEEWSSFLNNNGIVSSFYHAGMSAELREKVQNDFINDNCNVICATIAFGMGIDKSNVRWIIHNNLPKNIEGYYQEIGRAGRDGLPSDTVLYYNYRDVVLLNDFIQENEFKEVYREKIKRILNYAEATSCRRNILLAYFGETVRENCGNCDICNNPPKVFDGTIPAQKALSAISRCNEQLGINLLINVLRGSESIEIHERKLNKIKTYGLGKEFSFADWQHYINQMINQGLIEIAYDDKMHLRLTELAQDVLSGQKKIALSNKIERKEKAKELVKNVENFSLDEQLLAQLKLWRKQIAADNKVPPYVIFHDTTLNELAKQKPANEKSMLSIQGMGKTKFERFGRDILSMISSLAGTKPTEKKSTFELTFELYQQGLGPEEISESRNLNVRTIYGHLAKLYEEGKAINLNEYVTEFEVNRVKSVRKKLNQTSQLKPIFDELNGEMDYTKIGLALSILSKYH